MIKILARLDIHFGDMTLVLFDSQDEMRFQDLIHDSAQSFESICGELSNRLSDFDVATCDIDTHRQPSIWAVSTAPAVDQDLTRR